MPLVLQLLQQPLLATPRELLRGSKYGWHDVFIIHPLSGIKYRNASAQPPNFISSVILDVSNVNSTTEDVPGNTATLLIWLGASERPVLATRTPAPSYQRMLLLG